MTKRFSDIFALATLIALTVLFSVRLVNFSIPPFEDAAMLMRYAEHLAKGAGIVWNIGEPPLDGATDFLFMVFVALANKMGLAIESAVRILTIGSHFATVVLIYLGMRRIQKSGVPAAFFSAFYFAVGPGLFLSAAYFGTPVFTLGVALAWLLAQRLLCAELRTRSAYLLFSFVCLLVGLIRPEGVLISAFMLTAVCTAIPHRDARELFSIFAGVFLLLGGAYFLWRWQYFGHPLPNPFYKKGGGHLYFSSLKSSINSSLALGWPFIPVFLLCLRSKESLKSALIFLTPIIGSTCMWVFLSDEMNFGSRFQYPLLALYALSWYPLARRLPEEFGLPKNWPLNRMQKLALSLAAAFVLGHVLNREISLSRSITYDQDGRYNIGKMLSKYADRGYTLATTEAGLLPFYSKWRAIDTWGLNDKWIAHNGGITYEYLAHQNPAVIMWHGYFSPMYPPVLGKDDPWLDQVLVMKRYAEAQNYTLAAVFGTQPDDTHYYYVRRDLPEHDEIVQAIRSTNYRWHFNGEECVNYAWPGHHRPLAQ